MRIGRNAWCIQYARYLVFITVKVPTWVRSTLGNGIVVDPIACIQHVLPTGLNRLAHKPSVSAAHIVRTVIGLARKSFACLRTVIGSRSTRGVFGTCAPVPTTIADISACRTLPRCPRYGADFATSGDSCTASLCRLSRGSLCVMALRFDASLIFLWI